ncbi:hypothetical protein PM082_024484 [Marasmius tenuissimus]|nr:hypothetical protein PM082_024484 [Marasmius tenuissimus]
MRAAAPRRNISNNKGLFSKKLPVKDIGILRCLLPSQSWRVYSSLNIPNRPLQSLMRLSRCGRHSFTKLTGVAEMTFAIFISFPGRERRCQSIVSADLACGTLLGRESIVDEVTSNHQGTWRRCVVSIQNNSDKPT